MLHALESSLNAPMNEPYYDSDNPYEPPPPDAEPDGIPSVEGGGWIALAFGILSLLAYMGPYVSPLMRDSGIPFVMGLLCVLIAWGSGVSRLKAATNFERIAAAFGLGLSVPAMLAFLWYFFNIVLPILPLLSGIGGST